MTKEEFNKLWKDSAKEEILNQYYYDYKELQRTNNIINELGKYLEEEKDPFIENQINLWTDETKADFLGNRKVVKFYIRDYPSGASIYQEQVDKEIERLNNIINKGIEAINVYQNEKTLSIGYQDLKRIRGILQGNEFDLQMFEEYLQELKGDSSNE